MTLESRKVEPALAIDPTELTTDQLNKAIDNLDALLSVRLDAIEKALDTHVRDYREIPDMVRREIGHMDDLTQEKFRLVDEKWAAIGMRFDERDVRTAQAAETSQKALDAAMLAAAALVRQQNEANAAAAEKVELSFTKQLDQVVQQIQSEGKAKDLRISEIKERLDRGDGSTSGIHENRTVQRLNIGALVGVLGVLVAVVSLVIVIVSR